MSFLKKLQTLFAKTFSKPKQISNALGNVRGSETTCRYLFSKNNFTSTRKLVKPSAFSLPRSTSSLSVYRIDSCSDGEIWEMSKKYVEPKRKKKTLARADLLAQKVFANKLNFDPNGIPHYRHADIIGWPPAKDEQKAIQGELALASNLVIKQ